MMKDKEKIKKFDLIYRLYKSGEDIFPCNRDCDLNKIIEILEKSK